MIKLVDESHPANDVDNFNGYQFFLQPAGSFKAIEGYQSMWYQENHNHKDDGVDPDEIPDHRPTQTRETQRELDRKIYLPR